MLKTKKIMIGSFLAVVSLNSFAGLNCSIKYIDSLSPAKQLQELTSCNELIDIKLNLLKKQNKFNAAKNTKSLPALQAQGISPSMGSQTILNIYPDAMTSYDSGEAELAWNDGRRMTVQTGIFISNGIKVISVSPRGVELQDKSRNNQRVFIGFGKPRVQNSMTSPYPM